MIQSFDKKNKVLVLGGSGFIGMHLIMNLENEGYLVWNFDLNKSIHLRENYFEGDILNYDSVLNSLEEIKPDIVINLAASTRLDGTKLYDYKVNFLGVSNLVRALGELRLENVHLLHVSTQFVTSPGYKPVGDADLDPYTVYGEAKAVAELILRASPISNWLILRPSGVWGSYHPSFNHGLWKVMKYRLFIQPELAVKRSYIHVDTLAAQLIRFLQTDWQKINKGTYYLGNTPADPRTLMDAFSIALSDKPCRRMNPRVFRHVFHFFKILSKLGIKLPLDQQRYDVLTKDYLIDTEKTFEVIGEVPEDLPTAIRKTFD